MAHDCRTLAPSLSRVAAGEAEPDEALRVARHVPDCTACRILLARERRLADLLERELTDAVAVGEEFLRDVMARLPATPPAGTARRRGRRLRLVRGGAAGLAIALSGWLAAGASSFGAGGMAAAAGTGLHDPERLGGLLQQVARAAAATLGALGTRTATEPAPLAGLLLPALGVALPLGALLLAGAAIALAAAHRLARV